MPKPGAIQPHMEEECFLKSPVIAFSSGIPDPVLFQMGSATVC